MTPEQPTTTETLIARLEQAGSNWWSNAIAGACSASVEGMGQAQGGRVIAGDGGVRGQLKMLARFVVDESDAALQVVAAALEAAPPAQGPPEGTASAEPVVPASKLRALSEQWEQESDRVNLRHSSPRSAMRRCAADLDHLLDGETKTEDQQTATRVGGPGSSDRFGTAGTDGKGAERS